MGPIAHRVANADQRVPLTRESVPSFALRAAGGLARANLIAAPAASARAARRRSLIVGYVPIIFMAVTSFVPLGDRIVQRWSEVPRWPRA